MIRRFLCGLFCLPYYSEEEMEVMVEALRVQAHRRHSSTLKPLPNTPLFGSQYAYFRERKQLQHAVQFWARIVKNQKNKRDRFCGYCGCSLREAPVYPESVCIPE